MDRNAYVQSAARRSNRRRGHHKPGEFLIRNNSCNRHYHSRPKRVLYHTYSADIIIMLFIIVGEMVVYIVPLLSGGNSPTFYQARHLGYKGQLESKHRYRVEEKSRRRYQKATSVLNIFKLAASGVFLLLISLSKTANTLFLFEKKESESSLPRFHSVPIYSPL